MSEGVGAGESGLWTARHEGICGSLKDAAGLVYARLYERLVRAISEYSPTSESAVVDLALACHLARELMNGLPRALGETNPSRSGTEREAVRQLREALLNSRDDSLSEASDGASMAMVPANLVAPLAKLRQVAIEGSDTKVRNAAIAVLGHPDDGNPALIPWTEAEGFFQKYVHINPDTERLPKKEELLSALSQTENILLGRLGFFFGCKRRLEAVLQEANGSNPDGRYKKPAGEEVKRALSLVASEGLRRFFFSNLENPEWLSALAGEGAFSRRLRLSGKDVPVSWPEAAYLRRVAPLRPTEVSEILVNALDSSDVGSFASSAEIALELPAGAAVRVAVAMSGWVERQGLLDFWGADDACGLIESLLGSAEKSVRGAGKRLMQACFKPGAKRSVYSEARAFVPSYLYAEKVEGLADLLPLSARRGMFASFSREILGGALEGVGSEYVIPSVEKACLDHDGSVSSEVVYQLVAALRLSFAEDVGNTVAWLRKKSAEPLVVRCGFYAIQPCFGKGKEGREAIDAVLADYARELLLSEASLTEGLYDPEYYPLMRAALRSGVIDSDEIDGLISQAYDTKLDMLRGRAEKGFFAAGEDPEEYALRWQHKTLSLVGRDLLGEWGQARFDELTERFGPQVYRAEHVSETATFTGPNSPISSEEMMTMGSLALLDHLESWHPSGADRYGLVSHEGQGRQLTRVVAEEPTLLAGQTERVMRLRPTYQRAILSGLTSAVKNGKEIPVEDALGIVLFASEASEEAVFPAEGDDFDDDGDYFSLRREAARACEDLLECGSLDLTCSQASILLDALTGLVDSREPDADYEAEYGGDNMDPVTLSISTIGPIALTGLGKWVARFPGDPRVSDALEVIESHLPDSTGLLAYAGAVAMMVPSLLRFEGDWVEEHYDCIFGSDQPNEGQKVVLSAILTFYHPSRRLFDLLEPAMLTAMRAGASLYPTVQRGGDDLLLLMGKRLYDGYACGVIPWEDRALQKWLEVADSLRLGEALLYVCALAKHGESLPQGTLQRLARLWDYHAGVLAAQRGPEAINGAERLATSGSFEPAWWGERLLTELRTNPHEVHVFLLDEKLRELSEPQPMIAVELLREIVRSDPYPSPAHYIELGALLLGVLKSSNGGELPEEGLRCMDALGKIGCIDLDERLGVEGRP